MRSYQGVLLFNPQQPIKMLASVSNVEEALMALSAGVEMIDLKNPATGALGALQQSIVADIVNAINGRATVSATIGDLPMDPTLILAATKKMLSTGVDIVKIGFFGNSFHQDCLDAIASLTKEGARLIAVMFADEEADMRLIKPIAQAGFYGVMLDTAYKNGNHLLTHMSPQELIDFVSEASALNLQTGLAGSLQVAHISELSKIYPSYLGFRGALCEGSERSSKLAVEKIIAIKKILVSTTR